GAGLRCRSHELRHCLCPPTHTDGRSHEARRPGRAPGTSGGPHGAQAVQRRILIAPDGSDLTLVLTMTDPILSTEEKRQRRSIYLLPNAFTTANLFAGFYAVVQAMNGRYETAGIAIFLAMVFDGMDGRVARLTHTQSPFGEQYDSL